MKTRFKNNENGMTLVELIVAIGIFVAAIVPMLYAFVYSTGFNFKSQRAMQSTGIAQAIAEKCKSLNYKYSDLKATMDCSDPATILDGTDFTINGISGTKEGINRGMYWLYGVRATNNTTDGATNRRAYDVAIRFTEIQDSNTDYSSIQSMGHTTYNFGDTLSIALRNEDQVAQAKVINEINNLFTDSNITCSETLPTLPSGTLSAYFSASDINRTKIVLDRDIVITVSNPNTYNDPSGGSDKQSVQVKVNYYVGFDLGSDGVADTNDCLVTHDVTINHHSYHLVINKPLSSTEDYSYSTHTTPIYSVDMGTYYGFNEAASAVYFYYYPGYTSIDSNTANFRDHFQINNNMSVYAKDKSGADVKKLDVYLFKQYDHSLNHSVYEDREEQYFCDVKLNSTGHKTYLYHNLLWRVVEDVSHSPHIFKLVELVSPSITIVEGTDCTNCTVSDPTYSNYGASYKAVNTDLTKNGVSHVISNYAALPYLSLEPATPGEVNYMFPTRYRISVYVYPAGNNAEGNEIDIVTFEMLNW